MTTREAVHQAFARWGSQGAVATMLVSGVDGSDVVHEFVCYVGRISPETSSFTALGKGTSWEEAFADVTE